MKTYAQLNKFLGKANARLIDVKSGLRAERNPNGSIAVRLGDKTLVKFGREKEVTLSSGGERTPRMLKLLKTFSPHNILLAKGQWFLQHEMGYYTRLATGPTEGYLFKDGMCITDNGAEPSYQFDSHQITEERNRIKRYTSRFISALTAPHYPGPVSLEQCRCPYCAIKVNKGGTLGELDPRHLHTHVLHNEFIVPLLCRAVEKAAPNHHDDAVIALDKYMDRPKKQGYAPNITPAERKLLMGILRNYLLQSLNYPITTNGI
jgi:hypothetical protein